MRPLAKLCPSFATNLCDLRYAGTYSTGPKTRRYHDDNEFLASYMLE